MLKHIVGFELRYQLKQPIFYICFGIFFLLTFGAITTDNVQIGGSMGNINRNAPYVIMQILLVMSTIGLFTTTAFVASSIYRDFEHNTHAMFFSTPIRKWEYLGGRFLGSFIVSLLVFVGVLLAVAVGSLMPWLEPERIGPFMPGPYIFSMLVLVLPNIFFAGAIFFAIAAKTRSMLYTYVGTVGLLVAWAVGQSFLRDLDSHTLASLLDPFGLAAFSLATRYWTVFERNHSLLPLGGVLLANRLLWMGIGAAVFGLVLRTFRFTAIDRGGRKKKAAAEDVPPDPIQPLVPVPPAAQRFTAATSIRQYLSQSWLELSGIVKSVAFLVLVFLAVVNHVGNAFGMEEMFGTAVYPRTRLMLGVFESAFTLYILIILTFYAGELSWRERSLKLSEVYDSMPARTWVYWASKLTALGTALGILLSVATLASIGYQIFRGYYDLQPLLYFEGLFLEVGIPALMIGIMAFAIQVITNQKYFGFLLMVLYFVSLVALPAMHLEHHLYQFATAPPSPYSDMNGYGHWVAPMFWFDLYWLLFCGLLVIAAHLFWPRGTETGIRKRMHVARARLTRPVAVTAGLSFAALVACGGFIFYNTNVLNRYETADQREKLQAETEKTYKKYEGIPQPKIIAANSQVDIFPAERSVKIRGTYELQNRSGMPVGALHVMLGRDVKIGSLKIPGSRLATRDPRHGYYIYALARPMAPGERMTVSYDLAVENRGFVNDTGNTKIVYNGTFFNNYDYFPHFGYARQFELEDRNKRKKYGLAPVVRMPKVNDMRGRMRNYGMADADWMNFETTVSTSPDQIAIAPGYLQKEWVANGRRYFHYTMDSPMLGFWSYLSGRYSVKRDRWHDVAIEIDYDAHHPYNVDRMIEATKKSLDYFTRNFGPYQHRQVRIVEFPRYERFAQSFPNTIPFSESIGFIARIRDAEDIDYVFYVTAHEVAHQWWAHQVIGGDVQGATMLSETMAQYSALMVMEKEYGKEKMRRFLKYELDSYLRGRGGELVEEMPLMLVENQPYIHYRKGSLVMYALRDYIGEEPLNRAFAAYVRDKRFQNPPFTNSIELLSYIRKEVPPEKQSILTDLFETITLYDNRATSATATKRADGKYVVRFTVEAKKLRATGAGEEKPVALGDWIDIGVLEEKPVPGSRKKTDEILFLEKRLITRPSQTFEIVVDRMPSKAGIDPQNKLVDRNPEDNVKKVDFTKG